MHAIGPTIDLAAFVERHAEALRPPVGNARVFEDGDFIVMVVGGPNRRRDFHVDPGDELFYQLQGDIIVRVALAAGIREIPIRQGELFLLPAGVPHSPQRPPETIGLVVERRRRDGERDALRWYCDGCGELVRETTFALTDITTQLRTAIEAWESSDAARTCPGCGHVAAAR